MTLNGARILGEDQRIGSITPARWPTWWSSGVTRRAAPGDIYQVVTVFKDGLGYDSARLRESAKGLVGVR